MLGLVDLEDQEDTRYLERQPDKEEQGDQVEIRWEEDMQEVEDMEVLEEMLLDVEEEELSTVGFI
jgi:hypothetical protein